MGSYTGAQQIIHIVISHHKSSKRCININVGECRRVLLVSSCPLVSNLAMISCFNIYKSLLKTFLTLHHLYHLQSLWSL